MKLHSTHSTFKLAKSDSLTSLGNQSDSRLLTCSLGAEYGEGRCAPSMPRDYMPPELRDELEAAKAVGTRAATQAVKEKARPLPIRRRQDMGIHFGDAA